VTTLTRAFGFGARFGLALVLLFGFRISDLTVVFFLLLFFFVI